MEYFYPPHFQRERGLFGSLIEEIWCGKHGSRFNGQLVHARHVWFTYGVNGSCMAVNGSHMAVPSMFNCSVSAVQEAEKEKGHFLFVFSLGLSWVGATHTLRGSSLFR